MNGPEHLRPSEPEVNPALGVGRCSANLSAAVGRLAVRSAVVWPNAVYQDLQEFRIHRCGGLRWIATLESAARGLKSRSGEDKTAGIADDSLAFTKLAGVHLI